jgi:hypothetical protein
MHQAGGQADEGCAGYPDGIGKQDLLRTLNIWVFRLLGAIALAVSLLAGAEQSPLTAPDPLADEVSVGAIEVSVEAPIPLGSLDPESITAPAIVTAEHPLARTHLAVPRQGRLPALRAPPRRPPRLQG